MEDTADRAIAIVGVGAILPDAPNVPAFWHNIKSHRYSIRDVDPQRWDPAAYYDPDPAAPDKAYSKIGGWVREFTWDPMQWRLPIPPRVAEAMDDAQKWAIACTREALEDYGYPGRALNPERTAVILGNAMGGEKHYLTSLRIFFPEYARELSETEGFGHLPLEVREQITEQLHQGISRRFAPITEDTMPGELANCMAGRIANLFNFHGPNFVCDAACASAMAAISAAVEGLERKDFDFAITGGIDRNMGAPTFVKFCKIGALSATGTRPYAEGADGFVMGEGAVIFLLKRLAEAERDQDKIYAVLRGIGGSSDGKGKGITAPNPVGQKLCIERAWKDARLSPATATLIEGHGTSTRVGDVVEAQSMVEVLGQTNLPRQSVALGSVKSNVGHLKGAAGAAGLLKAALALHEKVLPPSLNCEHPSPDIDFAHSPLFVNSELRPWNIADDAVRRCGVSAFGFGGTNFHVVLEEHLPGRLSSNGKKSIAVPVTPPAKQLPVMQASPSQVTALASSVAQRKSPLRGVLVIGATSESELLERLRSIQTAAQAGTAPPIVPPKESSLCAAERLVIDYGDAAELAGKCAMAQKAFTSNQPAFWKALRAQGIFRGHGKAAKVAFLYTGQGSQYVNMMRGIRAAEPIIAETFAEADRVMTPLLGAPLSDLIFVDPSDAAAVAKAEDALRQTAVTQPAVLAVNMATTRLLAAYGIHPDMTMGHSVGEYGALVAAGALPFEDALEAVSARGREMTRVSVADNGKMAAVFAPIGEVERLLKTLDGYVVIANVNSNSQSVIGGASKAVKQAVQVCLQAGFNVVELPVSHAFHTSIVAPASEPLRKMLQRLRLQSPILPIVANVTGEFYPSGVSVPQLIDVLAQQIAAPVQFVKGLHALYEGGARVFVEVGPKKALQGFAEDVLGSDCEVFSLFTNHPKLDDLAAFNQALCGLYAAGLGTAHADTSAELPAGTAPAPVPEKPKVLVEKEPAMHSLHEADISSPTDPYSRLGRMFAEVLERGWELHKSDKPSAIDDSIAITGAAVGLPGTEHIFDDNNVSRLLNGEQFIEAIPDGFRRAMLDKNITRLVKSESGEGSFESIGDVADVIKLAGRGHKLDLESEFGISGERLAALDRVTQLALAAGLEALRDAGIPLVLHYKTTTKGTKLPDRWGLPDELRDDTGVIFGSAFPGYDSFAEIMSGYYADRARREELARLEGWNAQSANGHSALGEEIGRRIEELRAAIEHKPFTFDRRFLFRVLAMGHSQFAEYIGARGPNTQINAACATTTQAVSLAEDWIRTGRCRRVIIISADDVTSDHMIEWFGAGFLASGAAATDEVVADAATPFDKRRHGLIMGMGAAALVVESADAARERGIRPICEVLGAMTANSAFHGTRLDVQHISALMEQLITGVEKRHGLARQEIAPRTVFVSHETYTPARGGSASAEIFALRKTFSDLADQIVIANTKGYTGHAMATGIEDVLAVKALETGLVPPVPNFKEVDPELGALNLSKGGPYPVEYALRLGAGFGSQISLTLMRRLKTPDGRRPVPQGLGYANRIADEGAWNTWLNRIAGVAQPELEVVKRTLRVRDQGARARIAVPVAVTEAAQKPTAVVATTPPPPAPAPQELASAQLAEPSRGIAPINPATTAAATQVVPPAVAGTAEAAGQTEPVKERILALVVEKTGYPTDMLDLDLDLEADLGIDTVKQAEMFAAIRETYNIPRDENRKLRDDPTLAHVIRFVHEMRPDLEEAAAAPRQVMAQAARKSDVEPAAPAALPAPITPPPSEGATEESVRDRILALVVEKTGYPEEMLDLDLDLEADLGVDTVKQAEMFAAIREIYNIPRDENRKLRDYPTLAHVIRFVLEQRPEPAASKAVAPAAAPVAPVETPIPAAPASIAETQAAFELDQIQQKVLDIVAEKTGYPKEMLDLDLDLEADLGIDTVKQAEMFASVRAAYGIPRDENLKLRDFPTLAHVIEFAQQRAAKTPSQTRSEGSVVPKTPRPPLLSFDAANKVPRRIPLPSLRPPLAVCKQTGVKLEAGNRVLVMRDDGGGATALIQQLRQKGVEVVSIDAASDADSFQRTLDAALKDKPVQGVYWLPALDKEPPISRMDPAKWRELLRVRVKSLSHVMRKLYNQVAAPGSFLVAATRLGGQHGYDEAGAVAPMGGAVTGFIKAYKRERPHALVKVVDFSEDSAASAIAAVLIEETMRDPGAIEVGYKSDLRWSVGLQEQLPDESSSGIQLSKDTVFLITGAAGSIVSAITADLASASGGTFYLLDVIPEPDDNNPDLARFASDKDGLKRDLFARIQARGERATPALVERDLAALERAQAAISAIQAVQAAGGKAYYFSVNLADGEGVANVIRQLRQRSGHIDVLLHAAGLERSHFLPDKDQKEFDLVFDVKADGWFNLLHAIGDMPLGITVAFSSVAGRFGNGGQTDYSAANDLLCKYTSSFRTTRPQTRGIVIDWTAWGGIGMATRGSIPKMMETAGIEMLPPEAGIPLVRRELTSATSHGEIVVAQKLGALLNEWDETGGLDTSALTRSSEVLAKQGPMVGKITRVGIYSGLTMETTLDPMAQPFLNDHRIDGTPVLPGVMGIEAFAEAALCLHPGWHIESIEEVNFLAPFKFYKDEPRAVIIQADIHPHGTKLIAQCRLIGRRKLAGQTEVQETLHFTARVRVAKQAPDQVLGPKPLLSAQGIVNAAEIYRIYFHGPAYQVLDKAWWDGEHMVGALTPGLPADCKPADRATVMGPRLIELCFQTAGLWEMAAQNRMGLPQQVHELSWHRPPDLERGSFYAVVTPHAEQGTFDALVVDAEGNCYLRLSGYRTAQFSSGLEVGSLKNLHDAVCSQTVS